MKEIRGRYGQHHLLNSKNALSMYLLKTKLLSLGTFRDFLRKYNFVLIKPLLGPHEVHVTVRKEAVELATSTKCFSFQTEDAAYEYLIANICTGKYYIIQGLPTNPANLSHFYITLHRESSSANWKVVKSTMVTESSVTGKVKNFIRLWKLKIILIGSAKTLGNAFPKCHTIVIEVASCIDGRVWVVDTILHDRNSKWSQYHSLLRNWALRQFLPATDLCTKKTLLSFLKTYSVVVIKPCTGQQGRGIVKIVRNNDGAFEVHEMKGIKVKKDIDELHKYVFEKYLSQKDYIVQQGISLAEIDGCPFDVRVITQFDEDRWIVTGILVKVAAKGYFISNRAGKLLTLESALSSISNRISVENYTKCIEIITLKASIRLTENIGELSIIGYDIGIDDKGAIWVIEGNYVPALSMFYMFDNNESHERISYYIKKSKKNGESKMNGREDMR